MQKKIYLNEAKLKQIIKEAVSNILEQNHAGNETSIMRRLGMAKSEGNRELVELCVQELESQSNRQAGEIWWAYQNGGMLQNGYPNLQNLDETDLGKIYTIASNWYNMAVQCQNSYVVKLPRFIAYSRNLAAMAKKAMSNTQGPNITTQANMNM